MNCYESIYLVHVITGQSANNHCIIITKHCVLDLKLVTLTPELIPHLQISHLIRVDKRHTKRVLQDLCAFII